MGLSTGSARCTRQCTSSRKATGTIGSYNSMRSGTLVSEHSCFATNLSVAVLLLLCMDMPNLCGALGHQKVVAVSRNPCNGREKPPEPQAATVSRASKAAVAYVRTAGWTLVAFACVRRTSRHLPAKDLLHRTLNACGRRAAADRPNCSLISATSTLSIFVEFRGCDL